jgi:hypothetical protein
MTPVTTPKPEADAETPDVLDCVLADLEREIARLTVARDALKELIA